MCKPSLATPKVPRPPTPPVALLMPLPRFEHTPALQVACISPLVELLGMTGSELGPHLSPLMHAYDPLQTHLMVISPHVART